MEIRKEGQMKEIEVRMAGKKEGEKKERIKETKERMTGRKTRLCSYLGVSEPPPEPIRAQTS